MSLARLLEQATPGPWSVKQTQHHWNDYSYDANVPHTLENARLIALAPDMAQLLIDIVADDGTKLRPSLLARYLELDGRAKEGA